MTSVAFFPQHPLNCCGLENSLMILKSGKKCVDEKLLFPLTVQGNKNCGFSQFFLQLELNK